jgi:hypothetical protein
MASFQHIQRGSPLVISATEYNAMLDAGRRSKDRPVQHGRHGKGFDSLYVHIVNATNQNLPRFSVLGLDGVVEPANDKWDDFCNRPVFKGVTPNTERHSGRFAILQEDAKPNQIVRAIISGITVARIRTSEDDTEVETCDITDDETLYLSPDGPQEVLWSSTGRTNRWAVIRLGTAGGGESSRMYQVTTSMVESATAANRHRAKGKPMTWNESAREYRVDNSAGEVDLWNPQNFGLIRAMERMFNHIAGHFPT